MIGQDLVYQASELKMKFQLHPNQNMLSQDLTLFLKVKVQNYSWLHGDNYSKKQKLQTFFGHPVVTIFGPHAIPHYLEAPTAFAAFNIVITNRFTARPDTETMRSCALN